MFISFDEWNVWYLNEEPSKNPEGIGNWPVAPRLLEDVYSAADAVVFGDLMITLLKNADRVHAASLAQLVNVIAPIMTEPGGPAWRQTTFYPFSLTAKLAKGGTVLEPKLASGTYETDKYGEVPTINSVAVRGEDGTISVFVVNRSMEAANDFAIKLPEGFALSAVEAQTLHEDDLLAKNTLEDQNRVVLHPNTTITSDADTGTVRVTLPPVSWTAVHVKRFERRRRMTGRSLLWLLCPVQPPSNTQTIINMPGLQKERFGFATNVMWHTSQRKTMPSFTSTGTIRYPTKE